MKFNIITVTRNSDVIFSDLLFSLNKNYDLIGEGFNRLIVVDNHSDSDFIEALEKSLSEEIPSSELIKRDKNYLYTSSINVGLARSFLDPEIDCTIIMNPDISLIPHKGTIQTLSECAKHAVNEQVIASAVLLFPDGKIEHCGGSGNSHIFYKQSISVLQSIFGKYNYFPVEWATGAFLCIPKEIYSDLGNLNEKDFPHWVSDQSYCRHARMEGYGTNIVNMHLIHNQGMSTQTESHKACWEDLPDGVSPNVTPITVDHIIFLTGKNLQ